MNMLFSLLLGLVAQASAQVTPVPSAVQIIRASTATPIGNWAIDATSVTKQGNQFNGASQLLKLDSSGKVPAVDGSQLTGIPSNGGIQQTTYTYSADQNFKGINVSSGANFSPSSYNSGYSSITVLNSMPDTTFTNADFGPTINNSTMALTTNGFQRIHCTLVSEAYILSATADFYWGLLFDNVPIGFGQLTGTSIGGNSQMMNIDYTSGVLSASQHTMAITLKTTGGATAHAPNNYVHFMCETK